MVEKEYSIETILKELAEIQNQGPKNYCVLGTRHCSYLHQQVSDCYRLERVFPILGESTLNIAIFFSSLSCQPHPSPLGVYS